jgi:fatty acid desaturase (delta-4 desaturase)
VWSSGVAFTPSAWQGKYWRIGNKFYDLTPYLDKHPGGRMLLELARNRFDDATYAFEAHHHNQTKVRKILARYEVKGVTPPNSTDKNRTFPNLTPSHSFYSDFRRRVTKHLKEKYDGNWGPTTASMCFFWFCVVVWLFSVTMSLFYGSLVATILSALSSGVLGGFGHNFIHQPKYKHLALSLDISGFSSHCWYREHLLQHHMYTNTPLDNHFEGTEPFLRTDPTLERAFLQKYFTPHINFLLISFGSFANYLAHFVNLIKGEEEFHIGKILLPLQMAIYFYNFGLAGGALRCYLHFGICSVWYFTIALLNHNTKPCGDVYTRNNAVDWGHAQLTSSTDIAVGSTFWSSIKYLWLNFHTVHHLLPHTDMSKHPGLQRVLLETLRDHPDVHYDVRPFWTLYREMITCLSTPLALGEEINLYPGKCHPPTKNE